MPHFWMLNETAGTAGEDDYSSDPYWVVKPITGDREPLSASSARTDPTTSAKRDSTTRESAVVVRAAASGRDVWALLSSDSVLVNGSRHPLGLQVLKDRDELRIGGAPPFYFSTERLARVEPFPGADRSIFCPRCKLEIERGQPAVRCPNPGCGVWTHQIPTGEKPLPCWLYADTCPSCKHPTSFEAGYRWTPEEL